MKLNQNLKSNIKRIKIRVEIHENLFVRYAYVHSVHQQPLQHIWQLMVELKLSNVGSVENHIYLQQIQKLIRIVVHFRLISLTSVLLPVYIMSKTT